MVAGSPSQEGLSAIEIKKPKTIIIRKQKK